MQNFDLLPRMGPPSILSSALLYKCIDSFGILHSTKTGSVMFPASLPVWQDCCRKPGCLSSSKPGIRKSVVEPSAGNRKHFSSFRQVSDKFPNFPTFLTQIMIPPVSPPLILPRLIIRRYAHQCPLRRDPTRSVTWSVSMFVTCAKLCHFLTFIH